MKLLNYKWALIALAVSMGYLSCDLEDPDVGIAVEDVITLSAQRTDLVADSKSAVVLTAVLGDASDPNLSVTFTTSRGSFLEAAGDNSFSVAASGKTATATLISTDEVDEEVVVVASVASIDDANLIFKTSKTLSFTTAFPDDLLLSSTQSSISKTGLDDATITAALFRTTGVPSQDIKVNFKAISLDTATVVIAPFAFTGENAMAMTTVKSANLKAGKVAIIAEVMGKNGGILRDTLELNVVD